MMKPPSDRPAMVPSLSCSKRTSGRHMWVFGYGSLMWDGWETCRGCPPRDRRAVAELTGDRMSVTCSVVTPASPDIGRIGAPPVTLIIAISRCIIPALLVIPALFALPALDVVQGLDVVAARIPLRCSLPGIP